MPSSSTLSANEKNLVRSVIPSPTKILAASLARIYFAYPDPNSWSYTDSSIRKGARAWNLILKIKWLSKSACRSSIWPTREQKDLCVGFWGINRGPRTNSAPFFLSILDRELVNTPWDGKGSAWHGLCLPHYFYVYIYFFHCCSLGFLCSWMYGYIWLSVKMLTIV